MIRLYAGLAAVAVVWAVLHAYVDTGKDPHVDAAIGVSLGLILLETVGVIVWFRRRYSARSLGFLFLLCALLALVAVVQVPRLTGWLLTEWMLDVHRAFLIVGTPLTAWGVTAWTVRRLRAGEDVTDAG